MNWKIIITTLFLSIVPTFASYAAEETTQVMIELDAETDQSDSYAPNVKAKYELTLKNKLGPSWVRVKFKLSKKNVKENFTEENLSVLPGWVKRGDYYYYIYKADARTDIPVVDGCTIPDVSKGVKNMSVTVTVDADAVQYDAFAPDFDKENPWEGAEIKHSTRTSGSHSSTTNKNQIHVYSSPQETGTASKGNWEFTEGKVRQWKYKDSNGNYVKDGWVYIYNPYSKDENKHNWFHFDSNGNMSIGWYKASDSQWYYTCENSNGNLGTLIKGWHEDTQDGHKYYMDPKNGIMLSGWQQIDGKNYYFTSLDEVPQQTWIWDTGIGKWLYKLIGYKSYGAMYINEKTPDGKTVDVNGVEVAE